MSAHWLFTSSAEGWSTAEVGFNASDGYPFSGCLSYQDVTPFAAKSTAIAGLSIPVANLDNLWFAAKFTGTLSSFDGVINLVARNSGGTTIGAAAITGGIIIPNTWTVVSGFMSATDTVASLQMAVAGTNALTGIFFDYVHVAEALPGPAFLWQGVDTLAEKLELPFNWVVQGSLAVRFDGRVAVANNAGDGLPVVVTAGPEDDYGSYDDETNDHPDDEAVQRVGWIWT